MKQTYNVTPYILQGPGAPRWLRAKINGVWVQERIDKDDWPRHRHMVERVLAARRERVRALREDRPVAICPHCGYAIYRAR